jgi:hypothetical protein
LTYVAEKFPAWEIASTRGAAATKAELRKLVGGPEAPALLFTASHGAAFDAGDERQAADQGALLCADWPGPEQWKEPIPPEFYFSGADLAAYTPNLLGMINFHFACFGGGTPRLDRFRKWAWTPNYPEQIAPQAMVSGLPKALLSHQHGGALAVVGHVDRAWSYSFKWKGVQGKPVTFENALHEILRGRRLGHALQYFNDRHANIAVELNGLIEDIDFGAVPDKYELASLWVGNNDAQGYVIIGDPAVRLAVEAHPG